MLTKNQYGFLEYKVTKEDMILTQERMDRNFKESYMLNHRTVSSEEHYRIAGILAEIVFKRLFGKRAVQSPEKDIAYDFVVNDTTKVDVKCKCRNVPPKPEFEASIFSYQLDKYFDIVDVYCFMSTTKSFETVWVCGYIGKNEWKNNPNGKFWRKGDCDPSNGLIIKQDSYSVKYQYLEKFQL